MLKMINIGPTHPEARLIAFKIATDYFKANDFTPAELYHSNGQLQSEIWDQGEFMILKYIYGNFNHPPSAKLIWIDDDEPPSWMVDSPHLITRFGEVIGNVKNQYYAEKITNLLNRSGIDD